jgi:dolichyl-phosphate-mannose--protein O-mannosyl transferase
MICILVVQAWDISYLKTIKKLLNSSHLCQIFCHLIVVAVVLFMYLFYYQLRVSPDEKSPNAELLG